MTTSNSICEASPIEQDKSPRLEPREMQKLRQAGLDFRELLPKSEEPEHRLQKKLDELLRESLTLEAAAQKLGADPEEIEAMLSSDHPTLYGIRQESSWRIPLCQFDGDKMLPGLERVIPRLEHDLHPVAFSQWFQQPNPDLIGKKDPMSPREWLRQGLRPGCVATLAAHLDAF